MRPGGRELVSWGKGVLGRGNSSSRLTPVLTLAQPPPRRASPHAGLLPWTSPRASTLRIQCGLSLFPNLLLLLGPRLCGALPCPHPRVGDLDVGFIPCLLPPDPLSGQSLGPTCSPSAAFLPSVPTFLPVALPPPWSPGIPHHIPSLGPPNTSFRSLLSHLLQEAFHDAFPGWIRPLHPVHLPNNSCHPVFCLPISFHKGKHFFKKSVLVFSMGPALSIGSGTQQVLNKYLPKEEIPQW